MRAMHRKEQMSKKEQLMTSARKVMYKKGYSATRVSDIVADAKVAQGTFYLYFKSKEDVLLEMIEIINCEREKMLSGLSEIGKDKTTKRPILGSRKPS